MRRADSGNDAFGALAAVHVADAFDIGEGPRAEQLPPAPLDESFVERVGLTERLDALRSWLEQACPETAVAR